MTMRVAIVSAETEIFSGEADMVVATARFGEIGIKPKHAPLLAALKPGHIRLLYDNNPNEEKIFYVSSGYLEVQPDCVTILADTAMRADDLDEEKAKEAMAKAKALLHDHKGSDIDYSKALAELAEASAQLAILHKHLKSKERH